MNSYEREQAAHVLSKISKEQWDLLRRTDFGESVWAKFDAAQEAVRLMVGAARGAPSRPTYELVDLLGHELLSENSIGRDIREAIIRTLPLTKWKKLRDSHLARGGKIDGHETQAGRGSATLAEHWHRGSSWAYQFCEIAGLPEVFAGSREPSKIKDQEIVPASALPPLHSFQVSVYDQLRRLIVDGRGRSALLSLPTGAGKTRVAVEAICDHLAIMAPQHQSRNLVLWIARSVELQEQAWQCFRQVWQVAPERPNGRIERTHPLRIVQLSGSINPNNIEIGEDPTVFIAGAQQLRSWAKAEREFITSFPVKRLICVVIDEAQSTITHEFHTVLCAFQLRKHRAWAVPKASPLIIGLTATPWRTNSAESAALRNYFNFNLVTPDILGENPIKSLQREGILATITPVPLSLPETSPMEDDERRELEVRHNVPKRFLARLGTDSTRNSAIVQALYNLPESLERVLVFACSIEHAEILALSLNKLYDEQVAIVLTSRTSRAERADISAAFRRGSGPRYLCNVDILATGFDAPRVDAVCIAKPTASALYYEQMVGRGLRGARNGGTNNCLILDVQDDGLPEGIMSYARVADLWDNKG